MNIEQIEEIIECLPKGRTLFPYFQGRYALWLLKWSMEGSVSIADLKRSRFKNLLQKPVVRPLLASAGTGELDKKALEMCWAEPHECFLLTLGKWGGDRRESQQTTRPGHNLVLQLNLHEGYRRTLLNVVPEEYQWMFFPYGHPVLVPGQCDLYRMTLGWIRLDLDFATGEVIIEEIQSDWIRDLKDFEDCIKDDADLKIALRFVGFVKRRLAKLWDEALLCAALWFCVEELGMKTIWYHTFDTGNRLKTIDRDFAPPRSLYTSLPRRFCFLETADQPLFLMQDKKYRRMVRKIDNPRWFQMQL